MSEENGRPRGKAGVEQAAGLDISFVTSSYDQVRPVELLMLSGIPDVPPLL